MKLHYSATSPFVRKVMVAAHERGIAHRIEWATGADSLCSDNPLGKVPTLILDDGRRLFDSFVIVEWLNSCGSGPNLIPADAVARSEVLRRHALADGIMEAAVASVMEHRRPEEKQWDDFLAHQRGKMERSMASLDDEVDTFAADIDLSTIAVAAALGYVSFRHGDLDWRAAHPSLARWFAEFSQRPAMISTAPDNP